MAIDFNSLTKCVKLALQNHNIKPSLVPSVLESFLLEVKNGRELAMRVLWHNSPDIVIGEAIQTLLNTYDKVEVHSIIIELDTFLYSYAKKI